MPWRMRRTTAAARRAIAAGFLLSDHSWGAPTTQHTHGRKSRSAQTWEFLHHRCDRPRVEVVKIDIDWQKEPGRFLFRVDPGVRPRQLDGHIRKENSRRLAVRRSAMVRRKEQRAGFLVARPGGCEVARWFGSAAMIDELPPPPIPPDVKIPCVSRRVATNLRRVFHRDKLRRTLSDRQFLLVLFHYVRASVPVNMEREDRPIIVVDESRLDFIFHVGRRGVELRAEIGNLDRLAVLVFSFVG